MRKQVAEITILVQSSTSEARIMLKLSHMNPITPFYFASQQGGSALFAGTLLSPKPFFRYNLWLGEKQMRGLIPILATVLLAPGVAHAQMNTGGSGTGSAGTMPGGAMESTVGGQATTPPVDTGASSTTTGQASRSSPRSRGRAGTPGGVGTTSSPAATMPSTGAGSTTGDMGGTTGASGTTMGGAAGTGATTGTTPGGSATPPR